MSRRHFIASSLRTAPRGEKHARSHYPKISPGPGGRSSRPSIPRRPRHRRSGGTGDGRRHAAGVGSALARDREHLVEPVGRLFGRPAAARRRRCRAARPGGVHPGQRAVPALRECGPVQRTLRPVGYVGTRRREIPDVAGLHRVRRGRRKQVGHGVRHRSPGQERIRHPAQDLRLEGPPPAGPGDRRLGPLLDLLLDRRHHRARHRRPTAPPARYPGRPVDRAAEQAECSAVAVEVLAVLGPALPDRACGVRRADPVPDLHVRLHAQPAAERLRREGRDRQGS